jgi:N-acetylneuraminic acid mutarotase
MSLDDTLERPALALGGGASAWVPIGSCPDLTAQTSYPVAAVRDGQLFVYGGDGANTVLSTADGVTWTKQTGDWPARSTTCGAALDGQLYIVGGFTSASGPTPAKGFGDTWVSDDGATWTQIGGAAPWGVRWAHTLLPFRGHLFMIAGVAGPTYSSDVWALEPEGNWRLITTGQFQPRAWAAGAVVGRTLMVIGGINATDGTFAETLVSKDAGLTWNTYKTPFPARHSASALTIGDTVYLVGGVDALPGGVW